ncbi:MAG: undecaprenyl-phosphate glucose phosphotransferase [Candidatus Anammoxibacter sp.]
MLKKHKEFYSNLVFMQDMVIISVSWILSFYLRLNEIIIPISPLKGPPELRYYLILLVFIIILWRIIFKHFNLYNVKSTLSPAIEVFHITKATTVAIIFLTTITYFFRQYEFSRAIFLYFWFISIVGLSISRVATRKAILYYRKRTNNQRHVLIVGVEALGNEVLTRLERHPELGLNVVGFLSNDNSNVNEHIDGSKIIGTYKDIKNTIQSHDVELVIIALPLNEHTEVKSILKMLEGETVDIKLVPDFFQFITLRGETEEFDGLTFINVQSSPLFGWNVVNKRIFDTVMSFISIILSLPIMLIVAIIIKLTSKGPIIYKQERMGLDGRVFDMYKFRSMKIGSETETGPVWATKDDPRKTWIGKISRATSIDELPQLFNVLKGEMSLVGPRPERTVFIEEFKEKLPRYMLRHKVKAGMTGWAQVNGWRGDTSIEKRIEHDLYYIEHWSIGFDAKIVLLTLWKGFINKNAY